MPAYGADLSELKNQLSSFSEMEKNLEQIQREVRSIGTNLALRSSGSNAIRQSIIIQSGAISQYKSGIRSLQGGVESVIRMYENTENKVKVSFHGIDVKVSALHGASGTSGIETTADKGSEGTGNIANGIQSGQISADDKKESDKSAAFIQGGISGTGEILGIGSSGELNGELIGGSYDTKTGIGIKYKKDKDGNLVLDSIGIEGKISAEGHVAKGEAKGNIGLLGGSASVILGQMQGEGAIGANLYKDGKLAPQVYAKAGAEVTAVQGKAEASLGSDNNNAHVKAKGKAGIAGAKAEASAGKITYKDESGKTRSTYGVKGEAGAEAYAVEGEVSGGITILGVDIDVSARGKAGGAGAKAGGHVSSGGIGGSLDVGVLAGFGLTINIDWSDFKFGW